MWFVIGVALGLFVLGSCVAVQPAWDGAKEITGEAVTVVEDVVIGVYQGGKSIVGSGVGVVEGTVEVAYDLVIDPFTGDDVE